MFWKESNLWSTSLLNEGDDIKWRKWTRRGDEIDAGKGGVVDIINEVDKKVSVNVGDEWNEGNEPDGAMK